MAQSLELCARPLQQEGWLAEWSGWMDWLDGLDGWMDGNDGFDGQTYFVLEVVEGTAVMQGMDMRCVAEGGCGGCCWYT